MLSLAIRPGCSIMLELRSTRRCFVVVCFVLFLACEAADSQNQREVQSKDGIDKLHPERFIQLTEDLGPLRIHSSRKPQDLGPHRPGGQIPPQVDLGPRRPNGQVPPARFTPHVRELGHRLSNRDSGPLHTPDIGRGDDSAARWKKSRPSDIGSRRPTQVLSHGGIDIGPQRPGGQFPPIDLGPHRPNGQLPPEDDAILSFNHLLEKGLERFRRDVDFAVTLENDDSSDNDIEISPYARITVGQGMFNSSEEDWNSLKDPHDLGPHRPMGSTDPNGVPSAPGDLGPQRPSGQHPPEREPGRLVLHSNPGDLGPHRPAGGIDPNGIPSSPSNLGPHRPFGQHPPSTEDLGPQRPSGQHPPENDPQRTVRHSSPVNLGPHRPAGMTDPNGIPAPPSDLGPQRPSGQHPPSTDDLGPQRPSGQHPPSDDTLQRKNFNSPPVDLGPHRPAGATDPNGIPSPPSDLGPQRPSGQHPPSTDDLGPQRPSGQHPPSEKVQRMTLSDPDDLGPHRPSGQHPPPSDLGPQRPSGQHPPENATGGLHSTPLDVGPHRPAGATDPNGIPSSPSDLGPQRPSGQHPPSTGALESQRLSIQHSSSENASQRIVRHSPVDLGPHRPSGSLDPNGIPSPPSDLGPQRPFGQHPPPSDLGPQRPSGQHPPPSDLGPQRPFGQHPPPSDLGPQRPFGQHPPPSDLGPQRPFGQHPPPSDLGPQRPSGQHPPPSDLGPQRPFGQHPPPSDSIPQIPFGLHAPLEDLGLQRPSEEHPATDNTLQRIILNVQPVDLGPHRPSGATDPNGLPSSPSDLGPQRPSGQHPPTTEDLGPHRPSGQNPPRENDPVRVESNIPVSPLDLGPHRPMGPIDPNVKPGTENDPEQTLYNVYWNVPTFMCHKHGYTFRNLHGEYGIVQNPDDTFRGSRLTILYDPGMFPAVLQDEKGKKYLRNGGVPQEGDLQKHLEALEEAIEEQVPKDFDGLGVIDFEAWRPVWAQNWGALNIYRSVSVDLEKRRDPAATRRALEIRAKARFEAAARVFFEATLILAHQIRPKGRWGFYGFPHCFNQVPSRPADYTCAPQHQIQNDKIDWLWKASSALYPSVYLTKGNKTAQDESAFVSGRLAEAQRLSKGIPVYAYVWYRYHDLGTFLSEEDLSSSLNVPRRLNIAGTILWGSSSDLNSREKCARFSQAVQDSIGPAVARATGRLAERKSPAESPALRPAVIFAS